MCKHNIYYTCVNISYDVITADHDVRVSADLLARLAASVLHSQAQQVLGGITTLDIIQSYLGPLHVRLHISSSDVFLVTLLATILEGVTCDKLVITCDNILDNQAYLSYAPAE